MEKVKVGAVSYLNTKPLIYGFESGMMSDEIDLKIDYPARIADELIRGTIDVGLVPVAILPELKQPEIISTYGITCDGKVATVCLFSQVSVDEITHVYLDYQSRTSVALLKILFKEYWKKSPVLLPATPGFEQKISGTTAALVIGDRAFPLHQQTAFVYDLGEIWKQHTGLPFVFAAWIANKQLTDDFKARFDEANALGILKLDEVIQQHPYPHYDLKIYYTSNIKFKPESPMAPVISLFLEKLKAL